MFTEKQRKFTLKYFETGKPAQSMIEAGYSPKFAAQNSDKLLKNTNVQALLKELRQKAEDASVAPVLERKQVLTQIIRSNFSQFTGVHGKIELTADNLKSSALSEIKVAEFTGGKEGRAHQITTTVKLRDPIAAINTLNDMENIGKKEEVIYNDIKILVVYEQPRQLEGRDAAE